MRYGLPIAKLIVDLSASRSTIGALVLAAFALSRPRGPSSAGPSTSPPRAPAVWTVASAIAGLLTFLERSSSRRSPSAPSSATSLGLLPHHDRRSARPGSPPPCIAAPLTVLCFAVRNAHRARASRRRRGRRPSIPMSPAGPRGPAPATTTPRSPRSGCTSCSRPSGWAACSRWCCCGRTSTAERLVAARLPRYSTRRAHLLPGRRGLRARERRDPRRHARPRC